MAVLFAVTALHLGMSRPENNVKHFGVFLGHLLQGGNGIFDTLVRAKQAEGKEHDPSISVESLLVKRRIKKGDIGCPVWNHQNFGCGDTVNFFEQLHRHLRLHHHQGGELADTAHRLLLTRGRLGQNGMEGGHRRFFQRPEQMNDVTAIFPAKDAKFVLQANHIDWRNIDKIGCPLVITAVLIANMKTDFAAVWIALGSIVQRDHFEKVLFAIGMSFPVYFPEILRQVGCVRGNAAAARRIGGNKSHL